MQKNNVSGKSVLLSLAISASGAMVLWFWVAHTNENVTIVTTYIDRNKATNSAIRLLGWGSVPPAARDLLVYSLYMSVPGLFVIACGTTLYNFLQGESEEVV